MPILKARQQTYTFGAFNPITVLAKPVHWGLGLHGQLAVDFYPFDIKTEIDPILEFTMMAEVADLDNLLGFKGNYMIFPLKESKMLTNYMMLDDFERYVCCLQEHLSETQLEKIKGELKQQYAKLLSTPRRSDDIITAPTGSLFIEALPVRHSLMEEFKARHRAIDVKEVQAKVRRAEIENSRFTARLLAGEREDPDIEKKIIIEGNPSSIVPSDG